MKKYLHFLPLLFAPGLLAQEELPDLRVQNSGGTVQELFEVKLLRVEPDGLRVLHAQGAAKVPYELLPEALQLKYGFNADQAQEHRNAAALAAGPNRQGAGTAATASGAAQLADGSRIPGWYAAAGSPRTPSSTWTDTANWVTNNSPTTNNPIPPTSSPSPTSGGPGSFASNSSGRGSFYSGSTSYYSGSSSRYRSSSFSGDHMSRSWARVGRYGTPVVARVNSRGSSRSSVRYYGAGSNCAPYRSPVYLAARPVPATFPQYRFPTYTFGQPTVLGSQQTTNSGGRWSYSCGN